MPPRVAEELHSYIRHNYMEGLEYEGYEYDIRREDKDEGTGDKDEDASDEEGGHDRGLGFILCGSVIYRAWTFFYEKTLL